LATPKELPTTSVRALHPPGEPTTMVLVISGRVARDDIGLVCGRARALLQGNDPAVVVLDVRGVIEPDVAAVDALARLQLSIRRRGCEVRLLHPCGELQGLLTLVGLHEVIQAVE
jgi:ABC-type transporter Mla MlaB component